MNILMTGFTALQIGRFNKHTQKINVPQSISEAMVRNGHTVDFRDVELGEDLSGYDLIWVNLARLLSLNSRVGAIGSLYALGHDVPLVGFHDDWQSPMYTPGDAGAVTRYGLIDNFLNKAVISGTSGKYGKVTFPNMAEATRVARAMERDNDLEPESLRVGRFFGGSDDDTVIAHEAILKRGLARLAGNEGYHHVCPGYRWGDRSSVEGFLGTQDITWLDASPTIQYILDAVEPVEPTVRAWMLASLSDQTKWVKSLDLTWPVQMVGARKLAKASRAVRVKTEEEVLGIYNGVAGVLSPPYDHAGSGWWRSRYIYALHTGAVMLCDPRDAAALGPAYSDVTSSMVETSKPTGLHHLAERQAKTLRPMLTSLDEFTRDVEGALEKAVSQAGA